MTNIYNIYCDESCHLENDGEKVMVLGAIWCPRAENVIYQRVTRIGDHGSKAIRLNRPKPMV